MFKYVGGLMQLFTDLILDCDTRGLSFFSLMSFNVKGFQ